LRPGQTVEIITPGAGGYGAPSERNPAAVARDVADGRIDFATAAAIYLDRSSRPQ
jgi:N-methylhydantoinase B